MSVYLDGSAGQYGLGSALAMVLFLIMAVFTIVYIWLAREERHNDRGPGPRSASVEPRDTRAARVSRWPPRPRAVPAPGAAPPRPPGAAELVAAGR